MKKIQGKILFFSLLIFFNGIYGRLIAQEGIISSVYIAEINGLKKMQEAQKAGNRQEVERISSDLKELIKQKKSCAADLLTLTESSIEKAENENSPDLTPQQRIELEDKIAEYKSRIRIMDLELKEIRLQFFLEKHKRLKRSALYEQEIERIKGFAAESIANAEKRIKESEMHLKALVEGHQEEIENKKKSIEENRRNAENEKKLVAQGKGSADNLKSFENNVKYLEEDLEKVKKEIEAGTYKSRVGNWYDTRSYRELIAYGKSEIEKINSAVADGSYQHRYSGPVNCPTINDCKKVISDYAAEIDKEQALYRNEEWGNQKSLRQTREYYYSELLKLQEKAGSRDKKIEDLKARRDELKRFLMHDFLTELPKEDSDFIKAVKWLVDAVDKVNQVTEKFEKTRKVFEFVRDSSNPVKAINLILKEATGKDLTQRLAEKLLPEKVLKSPLVQKLLNGENLDRKQIAEELIKEQLPDNVRRKVETALDLIQSARSNNIKDLIAHKGFEEAMCFIESQPELQKAYDTFNQAHSLIKNPEILEDMLKDTLREKAAEELKAAGKELVDSLIDEKLKTRMEDYQQKLDTYKAELHQGSSMMGEKITGAALKTFNKAINSRIGLDDDSATVIENLVNFIE